MVLGRIVVDELVVEEEEVELVDELVVVSRAVLDVVDINTVVVVVDVDVVVDVVEEVVVVGATAC